MSNRPETNKQSCPVYKKCGGCQLQNLSYPEQLEFKQKKVEKLLKRFCTVEKIIGMKTPYHYRNKVQAAFYTDKKGKIISGVYQSGSHHVVGIHSCQTEDVIADKIIVAVRKLLPSFRMTTYNEDTGKGFLRHILVKRGFATNQIMLVLVTGTPVFPSKNNFVKAILKQFPEITTLYSVTIRKCCTARVILRIFSAVAGSEFRRKAFTKLTPFKPKFCTAKQLNLQISKATKPCLTPTAESAQSA